MFNLLVTSDLTSGMHGCLTIDYTFFLDFNRILKVRQFDKGHKNCHFLSFALKRRRHLKVWIIFLLVTGVFEKLKCQEIQVFRRQVANLGCKLISVVILTKITLKASSWMPLILKQCDISFWICTKFLAYFLWSPNFQHVSIRSTWMLY